VGFLNTPSQPPMAYPGKKPVERGRGARRVGLLVPHALATSPGIITVQSAHRPIPISRSLLKAPHNIGLEHDLVKVTWPDILAFDGYMDFSDLICMYFIACTLLVTTIVLLILWVCAARQYVVDIDIVRLCICPRTVVLTFY
jgi:hypothetical protein